jgi:prophage regulatory protein
MAKQILRKRAVRQITGLSDSTIWRLEKAGKFPQRVQLSSNAVGWYEQEIDAWLEQRERRVCRPSTYHKQPSSSTVRRNGGAP